MAIKLFIWHRRIGLVAALFIVFLVATGIALQHSDDLKLPTNYLSNAWLLEYYGIKPNPITTYQLGNQTVSHAGETIYLSGKPIDTHATDLHGAITITDEIIIATSNSILICDHAGSIIDEITKQDGLQEVPLGIAISNQGTAVIRGVNTYWERNQHLTNWNEFKGPHPKWVAPSITLPTLKHVIETHDMSQQISLERFMLDAHSGRFFGKYGAYVIDAAAILLLTLAITGIWLWATRR
jgi:hypothetical protein